MSDGSWMFPWDFQIEYMQAMLLKWYYEHGCMFYQTMGNDSILYNGDWPFFEMEHHELGSVVFEGGRYVS
jgi:hypothetical protein